MRKASTLSEPENRMDRIPLAAVPKEWRIPRRKYWNLCYHRAVKYLIKKKEYLPAATRLIHRRIHTPAGKKNGRTAFLAIGHAWVELPGDIVFDPVTSEFYEKAAYYQERQAVSEAAYGKVETAKQISANRHSGPWHDWSLSILPGVFSSDWMKRGPPGRHITKSATTHHRRAAA